MKKVIVLVSDDNYLEHTKYLFSHIKNDTNYDGDLCLLTIEDIDTTEFEERQIFVKKFQITNSYYQKFNIFDTYFKQWDKVLYLDTDTVIIKNDINKIFELQGDLYCEPDVRQIKNYFKEQNNVNLYNILGIEFDIEKKGFSSAGILFNTSIIDDNTKNDLFTLSDKYEVINEHTVIGGKDQAIFNLKFINDWEIFPNNEISFFSIEISGYFGRLVNNNYEYYSNRPDPENTIIYHFTNNHAPWKNHRLCWGSRFTNNLGKTYFNIYKDNLNKF